MLLLESHENSKAYSDHERQDTVDNSMQKFKIFLQQRLDLFQSKAVHLL